MSSESVANILRALHDAVLEAQRLSEEEHVRQLARYTFGEQDGAELAGRPRLFSVRIPDSTTPATQDRVVDIPLLALMPPSSLKIRNLMVNFRAKLVGFVNDPGTVRAHQVVPTDPPVHSGPLHAVLGAADGDGDVVEFQVTFESADPPEAFARLVEHLTTGSIP
jgi:hypothetical protein